MFLRELTELSGVSGCEFEVRNYIKDKLSEIGCEFRIDKIGNIIAHNKGSFNDKSTVITAHMDEVGLVIYDINQEGFIKFKTVGDIDPIVLNSKIVKIGKNKIIGVIGSNPIHLMSIGERGKPLEIDSLYIDIGVKSREEAVKYVHIGDYATFKSDYTEFGESQIKAKALGSRAGCAAILEILKIKPDIDFYGIFTVMKEVGSRGAYTSTYSLEPDLVVTLDETECADIPNVKEYNKFTELGKGVAISFVDDGTIYDISLIKKYMRLANDNNIQFQVKKSASGTNDSRAVHTEKNGVKVFPVLLPCRYTRSNVSVADKNDYKSIIEFTKMILQN